MHVYVYIKGAVAIQVQKTDETEAVQLKKKTVSKLDKNDMSKIEG